MWTALLIGAVIVAFVLGIIITIGAVFTGLMVSIAKGLKW